MFFEVEYMYVADRRDRVLNARLCLLFRCPRSQLIGFPIRD